MRGAASPCGVLPPQRQTPAKAERPRKQAGTAAIVAESRTGDLLIVGDDSEKEAQVRLMATAS